MSWIHIDDIVGIFLLALDNADASGADQRHGAQPGPQCRVLQDALEVLRKPYTPWRFFLPIGPPDFVLQLMLGEVADVVTAGQKVLPSRAGASATTSSFRTWWMPCGTSSPRKRHLPHPVIAGRGRRRIASLRGKFVPSSAEPASPTACSVLLFGQVTETRPSTEDKQQQ